MAKVDLQINWKSVVNYMTKSVGEIDYEDKEN